MAYLTFLPGRLPCPFRERSLQSNCPKARSLFLRGPVSPKRHQTGPRVMVTQAQRVMVEYSPPSAGGALSYVRLSRTVGKAPMAIGRRMPWETRRFWSVRARTKQGAA